ncbi:MAG: hypothetical protein E7168_06000 [Firmicutes bacterium]|nr:hypothetical protein [Bacillota bacterium]
MEIIKNNFRPVRFTRVRCKYCKSKLKVTYEDLNMYYNAADFLTSYYFKCPCCKENISISLRKGNKLKKPR